MKQDNLRATPQPHGRPRKKSSLAAVGTAPSMEQRRGRAAALPRQCRRRRAPVPPTSCRHSIHARSHARLSCQSRAAAGPPANYRYTTTTPPRTRQTPPPPGLQLHARSRASASSLPYRHRRASAQPTHFQHTRHGATPALSIQ